MIKNCYENLTRMIWVIAFGSPDSSVIWPKVYASIFKPIYQTFGTMTTPAAETKSIGLPADAQLSWFLHRHLDNFIKT
jgi:hypothetical protein